MTLKKKILIAPLDWGLGHATRCLAIIHFFNSQNYAVIIATTEKQRNFFKKLPQTFEILEIESYNIKYTKKKWLLPFALMLQIPKIKRVIKKENKWLNNIILEKKIDLVISDNRFGLYTKLVPCIFMTHQLTIKTPFSWLENWLQKINYSFINKFTQVWIPDVQGKNALAGVLSNPIKKPKIPFHYIGHLNRFLLDVEEENEVNILEEDVTINVLIMLSGPEPQRSILEETIIQQVSVLPHFQFVMLRGLPHDTANNLPELSNTKLFNHLPKKNIKELITKADYIIARSGYTTIMETLSLGKKCIFIPTPGQTEQEYLASYLSEQQFCISYPQSNFSLKKALQKANEFPFKFIKTSHKNIALKQAFDSLSF